MPLDERTDTMIERILKIIISLLLYTVDLTIQLMANLFNIRRSKTFVILTYHNISQEKRSKFEAQMRTLIKVGQPVMLGTSIGVYNLYNRIAVSFDDGYQSVFENAMPIMRQLSIPATVFVTTGCLGKKPTWVSSEHEFANERVLSEEQLAELPEDIFTIGVHSVTHPKLGEVDAAVVKRELYDSKRAIEKIINRKVKLISLPYGSYCKNIIQDCIDAGYDKIFLNIPTFCFSKSEDIVVGRINITLNEWPLEFWLILYGAYRWLGLASKAKRSVYKLVKRLIAIMKW
jgi:peptidoglycan/xylan/chitin deacetylase (PgdA/CDA1 family)